MSSKLAKKKQFDEACAERPIEVSTVELRISGDSRSPLVFTMQALV